MKTTSKKKKKKSGKFLTTRHGIALIALLAAMVLVVNLVVFSYSWFAPHSPEPYDGLSMNMTASIRSEKCTFETYQGTLVTEDNWEEGENSFQSQGYFIDQVAYSGTRIADDAVIPIPRATTKTENGEQVVVPSRVYFRTNVQNTDTQHPSVISLYHHNFPSNLGLAVTYPSNTYFFNDFGTDNGNYPDCWILRNAYVKVKDEADVDGPGLLQIEWFVENLSTTEDKSIRVTKQTMDGDTPLSTPIEWLYLMYN